MKYIWLQQKQKHIQVKWEESQTNKADYFSKLHTEKHYQEQQHLYKVTT